MADFSDELKNIYDTSDERKAKEDREKQIEEEKRKTAICLMLCNLIKDFVKRCADDKRCIIEQNGEKIIKCAINNRGHCIECRSKDNETTKLADLTRTYMYTDYKNENTISVPYDSRYKYYLSRNSLSMVIVIIARKMKIYWSIHL